MKKKDNRWLYITIGIVALAVACTLAWIGIREIKGSVSEVIENISEKIEEAEESTISIADTSEVYTEGVTITDVSDVVEEVMPAVVSITSRTLVSSSNSIWEYYFGSSTQSSTEEVDSGIGSGTIVGTNDTELLILTSYHVVEDASSLYVTFCDDEAVDGYIRAADEDCDIAVVAVLLEDIDDSTMESIAIAEICTEEADVGEGVIVIGNALGYGQSVTTGIVSAVNREITVDEKTISVIQTDAAINSGNSGGCVLNSAGQIIGISEAKISSDTVEGMCYAISVNSYAELIEELLTTTAVFETADEEDESTDNQSAYLGIQGMDASAYGAEGVYVVTVVSGSGAEEAGIEEGDIITAVDGTEVSGISALKILLSVYDPGKTVTVEIIRGTESLSLEVTLTAQNV